MAIFGQSAAGISRKLIRIRDFQVREQFPASQVPQWDIFAPDPHGGIWIGTRMERRLLALFREWHSGKEISAKFCEASPLNHQIIAEADGSVLAGFEMGSSDGGRVKCSG